MTATKEQLEELHRLLAQAMLAALRDGHHHGRLGLTCPECGAALPGTLKPAFFKAVTYFLKANHVTGAQDYTRDQMAV